MKANHYVLGVDLGTTSTKTVLFTSMGQVIAKAAVEYPLHAPVPAAAEQDPDAIVAAVIKTVRLVMEQSQVSPTAIVGLGFSAAMHSVIAIDAAGQRLTESITWADNRSAAWANWLKQSDRGLALYRRTGTPLHPMSPLVKLLWLRNDFPDLFHQAAKFISIKEYVLYHLCGEYWVDHSIASATGLMNLKQFDWDETALSIAGIQRQQLADLVPTTHIISSLKPEIAPAMGLLPATPIVIGASDGVLSNLGAGAMEPGVVAVTIGTSGAVRVVSDRPVTDPQQRLFCYVLSEQAWVVGGAVNNGGIVLRWVRDQLARTEKSTADQTGADAYDLLSQMAAQVPVGSDGLLFHPYLLGERSPLWDATARGSFFGLSFSHTKAHLVRAALEGILLNLRLVLQALQDLTGTVTRIQATGGFARSQVWRQMMADVFNQRIVIPDEHESSCLGAAILVLVALGELPSIAAGAELIGMTHDHEPIPDHAKLYQQIAPVYERLLDRFRQEYEGMAQLRAQLRQIAQGQEEG